jgi:hypothetical protein
MGPELLCIASMRSKILVIRINLKKILALCLSQLK